MQTHLTTASQAERYLVEATERTGLAPSVIERHVHRNEVNDVARSIVEHAKELDVDLIVMCAHGRGGIRHGLFGTVAQRVIRLGTTPVLLVPTPWEGAREFSCRRLLVPLDGNANHEQALSAVEKLGAGAATEVLLLLVIPTWRDLKQESMIASRTLPGTTVELLDASIAAASAYLDEKKASLAGSQCEVSASVVRGDAVAEIVAAADRLRADLILLGTHGKTHMDAFLVGQCHAAARSAIPPATSAGAGAREVETTADGARCNNRRRSRPKARSPSHIRLGDPKWPTDTMW